MTALSREVVERGDGARPWRYSPSSPRRVKVDRNAPGGPAIIVARTHNLEHAAWMASVRWAALHPGTPMPAGVQEWRRQVLRAIADPLTGIADFSLRHAAPTERRAMPCVAFYPPPIQVEGAA